MTIIDYLIDSDPSVKRMTQKYLLGENPDYVEDGWISLFLERFDSNKNTWGNGIYGSKWISTFYTLRDLVSLEIDPEHPIFQKGLDTLEENMWSDKWHEDDVCVALWHLKRLNPRSMIRSSCCHY